MQASTTSYSNLALLILSVLRDKSMYGYEIAQTINKKSKGLLEVKYCSMYPTIIRLIEDGYITVDNEQVVNNRVRVYYRVQDKGMRFLDELESTFKDSVYGICGILDWDVSFTEKAE